MGCQKRHIHPVSGPPPGPSTEANNNSASRSGTFPVDTCLEYNSNESFPQVTV
jgi:hypothetical protein